jgi:hypothetical protein
MDKLVLGDKDEKPSQTTETSTSIAAAIANVATRQDDPKVSLQTTVCKEIPYPYP